MAEAPVPDHRDPPPGRRPGRVPARRVHDRARRTSRCRGCPAATARPARRCRRSGTGRELALAGADPPAPGPVVPARRGDLVAEPDVSGSTPYSARRPRAGRPTAPAGTGRSRSSPAWARTRRSTGSTARRSGSRVGVVAPGPADVIGALQEDQVGDSPARRSAIAAPRPEKPVPMIAKVTWLHLGIAGHLAGVGWAVGGRHAFLLRSRPSTGTATSRTLCRAPRVKDLRAQPAVVTWPPMLPDRRSPPTTPRSAAAPSPDEPGARVEADGPSCAGSRPAARAPPASPGHSWTPATADAVIAGAGGVLRRPRQPVEWKLYDYDQPADLAAAAAARPGFEPEDEELVMVAETGEDR